MRGKEAHKNFPRIPQVALLLETSTEYGRGLLRGILRYARLHGPWTLNVAPGHLNQDLPKSGSFSGTGIIARISSPETERQIRSLSIPCVASSVTEQDDSQTKAGFGEIRTNSVDIARMAGTHLLEAGLRNFAFCGFANCHWSTVRERAFQLFMANAGFASSTHRLASANWIKRPNWLDRWELEKPILAKWLKSLPKPVGVMACNDVCGAELLQVCATHGLKVPDEVAVVGVDNDEMICELSDPPLSSVALDVNTAGYEAAGLLDSLMSGHSAPRQVVLVQPTHIVVRRSTDVIAQEDPMVARAMRFMREHSRHPLSVSDVSHELGVSRRTLERRVLRALGRTVLNEIARCHVSRAKQLLVETALPCYQIAKESGFGSLKSFYRCFTLLERTTPQSFRKRFGGTAIQLQRSPI